MARRRTTMSEQIQQAVTDSGLSLNRIEQDTGISKAVMSRFMSGERGITTTTLDVLAEYLDLSITPGKRKRTKGG